MVNPLDDDELDAEPKNGDHYGTKFLREGINYTFPDYICILSNKNNKVTFHLLVEDVLPNSSKMVIDDDEKCVNLKFCVITLNPHAAVHYAFMLKFPVPKIYKNLCELKITETKVILTIEFENDGNQLDWFLCGLIDASMKKVQVEDYQLRLSDTSSEEWSQDEADDWRVTEC